MKKSNLYLLLVGFVIVSGMYATNVILSKEYLKIDTSDPYKNYVSIPSIPYTVLVISGSNGYPIEIRYKDTNSLKVLRSRIAHFKSVVKKDTLFIEFTGSNIPIEQRFQSNTLSGIIIEKNNVSSIINTNTHQRISGFSNQDLKIIMKELAYVEVNNCSIYKMEVDMLDNSQIEFSQNNTADSLIIAMKNTSIARLYEIEYSEIKHTLSDSITFVLSKNGFNQILK